MIQRRQNGVQRKRPKSRWHSLTGLFAHNPVLVTGIIISPAVVAAASLRIAVALSITMAVVTVPTLFIASLTKRHLPAWLRTPLYAVIASALLVVAAIPVGTLSPTIFDAVGMYFPLLAVNSVIFTRSDKYTKRTDPLWAVADAIVYVLGFALAVCLIGSIREILGNNTLWGVAIPFPIKMRGAFYPFFGFIVTAFLAAAWRAIPAAWRGLVRRHQESMRRDREYEQALYREVNV